MIKHYEHTQIGYLIMVAFAAAIVLVGVIMALEGFNWVATMVLIILIAVLVLFSSLTVIIWQDTFEVRFGPGLIRKKFNLYDILSSRVVKNPWYCGWGIRVIPQGLLFNVSGFHAVEVVLSNGSKFRIGTDVPEELKTAIDRALSQKSSL